MRLGIGRFELKGALRVSDPTFSKNNTAAGVIRDTPAGIWKCYTDVIEMDNKPYVKSLQVEYDSTNAIMDTIEELEAHMKENGGKLKLEAAPEVLEWDEIKLFDVGVESGRCGFFDELLFKKDDKFLSECAKPLSGDKRDNIDKFGGVVQGFGCVSKTGIGSGCYTAYVARNENFKVIAAKVVFIDD